VRYPAARLGIPDGQYAIAADRASTRARHEIDAAGVVRHARNCTKTGILKIKEHLTGENAMSRIPQQLTMGVIIGNRGFFPSYLVAEARTGGRPVWPSWH
jgi:hypothetical protein